MLAASPLANSCNMTQILVVTVLTYIKHSFRLLLNKLTMLRDDFIILLAAVILILIDWWDITCGTLAYYWPRIVLL